MSVLGFTVVIETENLADAAHDGLMRTLDSLRDQDMPIASANEVLIIHTGRLPAGLQDTLTRRYPWLHVCAAPPQLDYYQIKMHAAVLATGAVVAYCDSDCVYEPSWLRALLAPFDDGAMIEIVAGETTTGGTGVYGTAMALVYIFPPPSGETGLAPTDRYFLNNVAFRRELLIEHPIPARLGLYRGNCAIHADRLRRCGHAIWRQPLARARHAPPGSPAHFIRRFLLIGRDWCRQKRLLPRTPGVVIGRRRKRDVLAERVRWLLRDQQHGVRRLITGLPIVGAAAGLTSVGYVIAAVRHGPRK